MNRNVLETVMGGLVLVVAVIFLAFAYRSAEIRTVNGYAISATFERVNGIKIGSDVRISGVKVGTVTEAILDPKTFQAKVRMTIDGSYKLPVDTVAEITSPGLLGDEFMNLVPGNDDKEIPDGGAIGNTVPPTDLMQLLKQVAFSFNGSSKPQDGSGSPPNGPAPSGPTPGSPDQTPPKH
jgi:phospholipid/cholesterol/gamma-HCH transport system substrate-binding protein